MHSALNKELSAQCSSRRIKQSASQTWRRPSDNACSPLAYLRHLLYLHFLKTRTFFFSPIETDTDSYQTSFWHPNKLCPLQCFLLAFLEFLAFFKPAYLQQNCLNNMTPNCCKNDVVFADVPSRKILRKVSRQRGSPRTKGNFDHYPLPSVQPSERYDFKCKETPKNWLCIIPFVVGICPMCLVCC